MKYIGRYDLAPKPILTVSQHGDGLLAQIGGSSAVPIHLESETQYFYGLVDAQITFVTDASGFATGLVFSRSGRDVSARRLSEP